MAQPLKHPLFFEQAGDYPLPWPGWALLPAKEGRELPDLLLQPAILSPLWPGAPGCGWRWKRQPPHNLLEQRALWVLRGEGCFPASQERALCKEVGGTEGWLLGGSRPLFSWG